MTTKVPRGRSIMKHREIQLFQSSGQHLWNQANHFETEGFTSPHTESQISGGYKQERHLDMEMRTGASSALIYGRSD